MWKKRRQFGFRQRPVAQSEFYLNVVKPARTEAAVEMPQSRNDHSHNGNLDVGPGLVEDQKIETGAPRNIDAGEHLVAGIVERREGRAGSGFDAVGRQKRMFLEMQWRDSV